MLSSGPSSIAAEGVYRRQPGGTWVPLGPDQGPLFETDLHAIAFDPENPQAILLGGRDSGNVQRNDSTIWRSVDAGATWSKRYEGQMPDIPEGV